MFHIEENRIFKLFDDHNIEVPYDSIEDGHNLTLGKNNVGLFLSLFKRILWLLFSFVSKRNEHGRRR